MQLTEEIVKTLHLPQTPPVKNSNEWAIYGWMCYFWMNVSFMDKRAVPFLDECAISGWICNFWMNGLFMDECAIYGWICHFWMNVPFLDECAIYGWMCYVWMNVSFMDECAIFGWMCYLLDILWGQPIKLTQVASNSELRENQLNDLLFFTLFPLISSGPQK